MKMEDQVVCFDLSIQIKELGLPQNGIFAWYQYENQKLFVNLKVVQDFYYNEVLIRDGDALEANMICDAPTVAELGEMLPDMKIFTYRNEYSGGHLCLFKPFATDRGMNAIHAEFAKTEADARAKMWIYLKKDGML